MLVPFYDRNGITIYCGDCLEIMPQLEPPFDAIICDLPYGTTACAWDTIIPFEPLWENYKRLAKKNGAVVLFGLEPFSSLLRMSNLKDYKYDWIWNKVSFANFFNLRNSPSKTHENILIFCKSSNFTFNPERVLRTSKSLKRDPVGRSRIIKPNKSKVGINTHYGNINRSDMTISEDGKKHPVSILKYNTINDRYVGHPTKKPVDLMAYLIRTYTNPSDLILDNCIGSGTTLVAAQNEGRWAVGIEISEEYCKVAVDRLRQPSFFSIPDKIEARPKQLALLDAPQGGAE